MIPLDVVVKLKINTICSVINLKLSHKGVVLF